MVAEALIIIKPKTLQCNKTKEVLFQKLKLFELEIDV